MASKEFEDRKFKKGKAKTGGRKAGTANVKTRQIADACAADGKLTPLEYMLQVLRDTDKPADMRMDAAKSAAPYIHPRLASVEFKGDPDKPLLPSAIEVILVRPKDTSGDT